MINRIYGWSWLVVIACLISCTGIQVDKGPFTIDFNRDLIAGKTQYLEDLSRSSLQDSLPNILLILVDDLGKLDISTYDPEGVPTPAITRLAGNGVRFTSAYSTSSVCSPSRASLFTGRYQQRFGFERQPMNRYPRGKLEYWIVDRLVNTEPMQLVHPMSNPGKKEIVKQGIPPGEILLSELLSKKGYRTGIFGKWHLGHHDAFLPTTRGFDDQYGFYEAFTYYANADDPGIINYRHEYFANKHIWRQKRKGTCAIRVNENIIDEKDYLTFSIADRACRFLEQNSNSPFFLYVPFSAPHTPFQVPREHYDRFDHVVDKNKRVYYGMISAMDDAISQILDQLEKLGLAEHTLIVFASDNGGATYTGATDNGILKAGKFSQFEGGVNIPLIISWKDKFDGGSVYHHPVSLVDVFTTSAAAAGCMLPEDRKFDGVNLLPFLSGVTQDAPHNYLFWRTDFNKAVRNRNWKFVWNERDNQEFLYNLEEDPGEQNNLSSLQPEKVMHLKLKIREWESEMKDPMWPGVMEFRFDCNGEISLWAI